MNTDFDRHFAADVWEKYALGMLSEKDCESLEEHLLICSKCQDLLAEADEYICIAKAAMATMTSSGRADRADFDCKSSIRKQAKVSAALAGALSLMWLQ